MKKILFLTISLGIVMACQEKQTADNQLSDKEKSENWQLLFDGQTTNGWHLYNKGKIASTWMVKNGELYCNTDSVGVEHGDLISDKSYQNYELKFDWKISKAGNSGVFINVIERDTVPTAWASGPEYQLLEHENIGADYLKDSTKWAACLYGFMPQINQSKPKPAGQWNESRIIQKNGAIEFYLNGQLTAKQDFNSESWKNKVANSGFKYFPLFGKSTSGHIALQEWSKGVAFRNIKIKEL
ncbi:protein of unknown function DUF1080 [Emticicia oligotrophica DSM 17448]|uniref:3-keto-alpha-glucoside-1,2-lyase/3-keto-2-hydroxy-glucal hydratase domain-containing protein n=1 Tax=Emticicia oligotrophica (strain DSM 17448 / CIP 109782 / MTCC 6937 / GPTSA100-15) TaxID=929562 RepID=A0ABM5N3C2_EMTOG|nr:DUF1080 domain-containing protein [Emticicia oligotrophica]AFK03884.1 protein of unknown function DUF1080 [Emticicia oligotrophica DSM 17448]